MQVNRQAGKQSGEKAGRLASTRKAFSRSHALEGLVFIFCDFFRWTNFRLRFWACGYSQNENESSWNTDMFRHQNFENRTKIEGVLALTFKIF